MKCRIMRYFIWVFTVCQSFHLGVSGTPNTQLRLRPWLGLHPKVVIFLQPSAEQWFSVAWVQKLGTTDHHFNNDRMAVLLSFYICHVNVHLSKLINEHFTNSFLETMFSQNICFQWYHIHKIHTKSPYHRTPVQHCYPVRYLYRYSLCKSLGTKCP